MTATTTLALATHGSTTSVVVAGGVILLAVAAWAAVHICGAVQLFNAISRSPSTTDLPQERHD